MMVYLSTFALVFAWIATTQQGESLACGQVRFKKSEQKYLANHAIETKQADSELECGFYCAADKSCASINYKTSGIGKGRCELNDETVEEISEVDEKIHHPEFNHLAVIERNPPHSDETNIPLLKTITSAQSTQKENPTMSTPTGTSPQSAKISTAVMSESTETLSSQSTKITNAKMSTSAVTLQQLPQKTNAVMSTTTTVTTVTSSQSAQKENPTMSTPTETLSSQSTKITNAKMSTSTATLQQLPQKTNAVMFTTTTVTTENQEMSSSCKKLSERNSSLSSGIYQLRNYDSLEEYQVYCHMTEISGCGSGGWTLVMKIDGTKTEFNYSSPYWANKQTYAVEDGLEGLIEKQTKLASYWNTPFDKICLGMSVNGVTNWIVINRQASSLFSLIADGAFKNTTVGKNTWLSLMDDSCLQQNCNREGFNINLPDAELVYMKVRIGITANNENDCLTCNSCFGFGTSVRGCWGEIRKTTCGNIAICGALDNKNTEAFGYIFVK